MNTLYYGDNLDILRRYIADETVDLVYLDPPFNSNASYNVLFSEQDGTKAAAQALAFEDTWRWDETAVRTYEETVEAGGGVSRALRAFHELLGPSNMLAYLSMMAPRLVELRRVLKPTGSIYLHCDPASSHYLKVLMDAVFGAQNARNEIIWHYGGRGAKAVSNQYPRNHDVILYYSKVNGAQKYQRQYIQRRFSTEEAQERGFRQDEEGRWFKTAPRGDYTDESIGRLAELGRIHITRSGRIRIKYFLGTDGPCVVEDVLVGDTWNDIPDAMHMGSERLGYPTQKPEALLERIINASSNEGDLVLDPFCGCGTTVAVAERLKRRWIGIDITHLAIGLMKGRLRDSFGDDVQYSVVGEPVSVPDAEELARSDPYQFQWWALGLVGARSADNKKGADHGIDGELPFHDEERGKSKRVLLSVKAGNTSVAHVRDLRGVIEREDAEIGVLITMHEPTAPMRAEAAGAGFYDSPWDGKHARLQILTIAQLLEGAQIDMPPLRQVSRAFKRARRARTPGGTQAELGL